MPIPLRMTIAMATVIDTSKHHQLYNKLGVAQLRDEHHIKWDGHPPRPKIQGTGKMPIPLSIKTFLG